MPVGFLYPFSLPFHLFLSNSLLSLLSLFFCSFFCSSLLLDPIFLFISTFSCKLFSPASMFTYRKRHYLPPGNFNACLKRTAFWKYQQKEKHRWRVGLGGGAREPSLVGFLFLRPPTSHIKTSLRAVKSCWPPQLKCFQRNCKK